jgi:hypothetical protein
MLLSRSTRRGSVPRRLAFAGLIGGMGACTTVKPIEPTSFFQTNYPAVVWVTQTNNAVVSVVDPQLVLDTLFGTQQGTKEHVAIALADVRSVRAKARDGLKTGLLVSSVSVGAVSAMYFLLLSKSGSGQSGPNCFGDEVRKHPEEHPECQS